MNIEIATTDDAEHILNLQKIAYQSEARRYNDYSLPPLIQRLDEIKSDFKKQLFLKAVISGTITGSVRAYIENGTCFIGRLIVHPDYQKQGIGSRLIHHIEDRFSNADRFELFTGQKSEEALHLYNKFGYTIFKNKRVTTHTIVFLEKLNIVKT